MFLLISLFACSSTPAPVPVAFVSGAEGFDTTSWWVDTGAEVVVFDAQFTPSLAEALLAEIQASTSSPVRYVIATHPNPDKFNGASVFQEAGASFITSAATEAAMPEVHAYKEAYFVGAGMFAPGEYPALPAVDQSFEQSLSLELDGDTTIRLDVLTHSGVTTTQTVAWIGDSQVVVGDLGAPGVHAWLEGGLVDGRVSPDLESWQAALDEVGEAGPEGSTLFPGRGEATDLHEAVEEGTRYLQEMDSLVGDYVDGLDDPMASLTGPDAGTHYAAITAEAEAAFPTYDLSYLVTYGVYGLALQHAGS